MTLESIRVAVSESGLLHSEDGQRLISKRGGTFSWMFDLRPVFLNAEIVRNIASEFWRLFGKARPFQLAAVETAAIPLMTALQLYAPVAHQGVNCVIVRKSRKQTGTGKIIEGNLNDLPVVVVDDTVNSSKSAEWARSVLENHGGNVTDLFVIIDFQSKRCIDWRKNYRITVSSLFYLADFELSIEKENLLSESRKYEMVWRNTSISGYAYHMVPKSAPLLRDGIIYRGTDCGRMQALCAETGKLIWQFTAPGTERSKKGIWSSPALHGDRLFFGAYNGNIYCLSKVTGEVLWESEEGEWVGASPLVVEAHNLVYFGIEYTNPSFHGSLCAYDCDSGAKIWHVPVGRLQHGSAVYCEEGDAVVWGSADHEVLSLDALTGVILWRFATRRSVKCAPAVNEKRQLAAFASFDCSIYLVSTVDGRKIGEWSTGGACYTTPLFVENIIFCGSGDGYLYIIDTIQRVIVKKIHLGGRVYSSPVLHDRSVFIGCNNGTIYEIEVSSLSIIGRFQLPDAVTNKVSVSPCGNYIYATTFMNHLFCYQRVSQETYVKPEKSILGYNSAKLLKNSSCVSSVRYKSERGKIFFKKISQDIDISFIYKELISNESAWYDNERRQKNISVQRETESIFLRSADRRKLPSTIPTEDVQLSKETHVSRNFPTTMDWLSNFAKQRDKRLARAIIVRLAPGGRVYPHVDNGSYYATRDRFHLVVSSPSGSSMQAADERVQMFEGEVWWFDNKQVHHSDNPSDSHRIHIIFDLEPRIHTHQNVSFISQ